RVDIEGSRAVGHVLYRHLFFTAGRISKLIDLTDDDQRKLVYGCEVYALIKIARTCCAVTGEAQADVRLFAHLEGKRIPRTRRDPGSHRAVVIRKDAVRLHVGKKQTELSPVRRRLIFSKPS